MGNAARNGWEHHQAFNDWTLQKNGESIVHVYQKGKNHSDGFVCTMRDHGEDWFGQKTQTFPTYLEARNRGNVHLDEFTQQEQHAKAEMAKQHEMNHKLSDHWTKASPGEGQGQQPELEQSELER